MCQSNYVQALLAQHDAREQVAALRREAAAFQVGDKVKNCVGRVGSVVFVDAADESPRFLVNFPATRDLYEAENYYSARALEPARRRRAT